ncbi:MAG TPA: type II toxin-antitoxin system VapC family toxin, partial [Streptosporangiaceae bacterium]|nr:type II toxin-antitoxin system VapC family toxin [Streptosporangiaceae bacterium]
VKLVHAEAETAALRSWLDERADTGWTSSVLAEIESFRALARHAPDAIARLHPVLDLIDLVDLTPDIRILAQTVGPGSVRGLDAIHVATALRIRTRVSSFVTYDKRLADAAAMAGLAVDMPC